MQRRNYRKCSGIILDVCHSHGTWLDADELEQIAGFIVEKGGVPDEPNHEPRPAPRVSSETVTFSSTYEARTHGAGGTVLRLLSSLLLD